MNANALYAEFRAISEEDLKSLIITEAPVAMVMLGLMPDSNMFLPWIVLGFTKSTYIKTPIDPLDATTLLHDTVELLRDDEEFMARFQKRCHVGEDVLEVARKAHGEAVEMLDAMESDETRYRDEERYDQDDSANFYDRRDEGSVYDDYCEPLDDDEYLPFPPPPLEYIRSAKMPIVLKGMKRTQVDKYFFGRVFKVVMSYTGRSDHTVYHAVVDAPPSSEVFIFPSLAEARRKIGREHLCHKGVVEGVK
jgi:hypothetical protein